MSDQRINRKRRRREIAAVRLAQKGAPVEELSRVLKKPKERAARTLAPFKRKDMQMSNKQQLMDTSLFTELGGEPVMLTAQPDGSVLLTRRGELQHLSIAELNRRYPEIPRVDLADEVVDELVAEHSADLADDDEAGGLYRAWQRFREGGGSEVTESVSAVDFSVEDEESGDLYDAWKTYREDQGIDLSDDGEGVDLALKIGQTVAWGSGHGVGHGIVMEVDTAEGNVLVHTCEVVDEYGGEPALSPTGRTIKLDGAKLRKIDMPIVGERPHPVESPDVRLEAQLDRDLAKIRGTSNG